MLLSVWSEKKRKQREGSKESQEMGQRDRGRGRKNALGRLNTSPRGKGMTRVCVVACC